MREFLKRSFFFSTVDFEFFFRNDRIVEYGKNLSAISIVFPYRNCDHEICNLKCAKM